MKIETGKYGMCKKDRAIVITGPTASGKTGLAVSLAHRLGTAVLSADSRQVYRGLNLGTGKDLSEYNCNKSPVPYALIDIASVHDIFTLYHYQNAAYREIRTCRAHNQTPLFCGGTGLYLEAVFKGYSIPNVPENPALRRTLSRKSKSYLAKELRLCAPKQYMATDISSKKRIIRAIEVATYGKKHTIYYSNRNYVHTDPLIMITDLTREELQERIERRLDARLEAGMIAEVRGLLESGVSRDRMELLGLEYREISRYIAGEYTYETMRDTLLLRIRQFAKRQRTWFRGMKRRGFKTVTIRPDDREKCCEIAMEYVEKGITPKE
ncbi:MAG: tRNA (adenosine(37)-N6)-dimethylallyltransferase MiaA [Fibrobacterota bacterium]